MMVFMCILINRVMMNMEVFGVVMMERDGKMYVRVYVLEKEGVREVVLG